MKRREEAKASAKAARRAGLHHTPEPLRPFTAGNGEITVSMNQEYSSQVGSTRNLTTKIERILSGTLLLHISKNCFRTAPVIYPKRYLLAC